MVSTLLMGKRSAGAARSGSQHPPPAPAEGGGTGRAAAACVWGPGTWVHARQPPGLFVFFLSESLGGREEDEGLRCKYLVLSTLS